MNSREKGRYQGIGKAAEGNPAERNTAGNKTYRRKSPAAPRKEKRPDLGKTTEWKDLSEDVYVPEDVSDPEYGEGAETADYMAGGETAFDPAYMADGEVVSDLEYMANGEAAFDSAYRANGEAASDLEYMTDGETAFDPAYMADGEAASDLEYMTKGEGEFDSEYGEDSEYLADREDMFNREYPEEREVTGKRKTKKTSSGQKRRKASARDEDIVWDEEEPLNLWKTLLVFVGLMAAAAIICAAFWHFSHLDKPGSAESDGSETVNPGTSGTEQEGGGESGTGKTDEQNPAGGENTDVSDITAEEPISGSKDMEFTEVEQSVTPKDVVNLRSVPTTLDTENIVTQVLNGTVLSRTGINEDTGWSKIEYNGETLYAVSQYLTLDLNYKPSMEASNPNRVSTKDGRIIIFADCDDLITPKEYVNLRTEPSTSEGDASVSCQLNYGEQARRTGLSPDSGWSRVEYDGKVLYVVTSLISVVEE